MRKHFEDWPYREHNELIISLDEDGKSSIEIANKLIELYKYDLTPETFSRYIRGFLQWYKEKYNIGTRPEHHAKILIYDIETAPLMGYFWRLWKQNINPLNGQLISESWFMITWAAKWLFDDKVMADKLTPEEAKNNDDERIVKSLWRLFDEADIVVGHNILKFDNRQANTRFLKYGIAPPSSYQSIDTYKHAQKQFDLPSYKLDFISQFLGVGRKISTDFSLWERCLKGDKEALNEMEHYNIGDIKVNEEVYLKMRPFIKPHPNLGLYVADNVVTCPSCASTNLSWGGTYATYANLYNEFKCNSCGANGRSRNTALDKDSRKFLSMSLPK